ncbi:MAG: HPF/RaiA family ribosome-associated protein [Pseudomonadales bacterium]
MSIQIQAHGFELSEPLEQYTLARIRKGLGRRLDRVSKLRVGLSDINGPKGGADKRCQIHIALPRRKDVVVEEVQEDMYGAIDSAMRRARQTLGRRLSKQRVRKQPKHGLNTIESET